MVFCHSFNHILTPITDAGPFMPDEDDDEGTPFRQGSIFGTSTTAKGLFDESDEEKESSGGLLLLFLARGVIKSHLKMQTKKVYTPLVRCAYVYVCLNVSEHLDHSR